jgi:two-component system NtrC family sensor kinase
MSNLGTMGKYVERITAFFAGQTELVSGVLDRQGLEQENELRTRLKIDRIMADLPNLVAESLDGAERVKKIVQDLKGFSRNDETNATMVNLAECLESTINIVWNELKYKTTLVKDFGPLPPVHCRPQQLNQVFMNLLVNAAQAIEHQGTITVKTWQEGTNACISVTDTGAGIPEAIRSRIFEPFFTTKEVGKGTGLGLSISYDIIKNHGGELAVESEVGKGTTFTIRIPVENN